MDQSQQFDFYDGGGLDQAFLGMAEADAAGNVNVSRFGATFAGCGGFINISQNARKVVFLGTFSCDGLRVAIGGGRLKVLEEGRHRKLVRAVEQVTFSGPRSLATGHETLYVTERAVFRLTPAGMELTEVAPGVDLQHDVLERMDFPPRVANTLRTMDDRLFRDEPMDLHLRPGAR